MGHESTNAGGGEMRHVMAALVAIAVIAAAAAATGAAGSSTGGGPYGQAHTWATPLGVTPLGLTILAVLLAGWRTHGASRSWSWTNVTGWVLGLFWVGMGLASLWPAQVPGLAAR